jgi:hypothetical protein
MTGLWFGILTHLSNWTAQHRVAGEVAPLPFATRLNPTVILMTTDSGNGTGEFLTPRKSGTVRIVQGHQNRLVFQPANGDTFYFDVSGRSFVSSMDVVVPTATFSPFNLLATPTPTVNPSPYP